MVRRAEQCEQRRVRGRARAGPRASRSRGRSPESITAAGARARRRPRRGSPAPRPRAFAPDLRGAGDSKLASDDQVGREIQTYVEDLRAWTTALGLGSFVLAGHSFGGRLAVDFTATYPEQVEKLILIAAAGPDALAEVARAHPELVDPASPGFGDLASVEGPVMDALARLQARQPGRAVTRAVVLRWLANLDVDERGYARHHNITATADAQMNIIRTVDQTALCKQISQPTVVLRSVDESRMLRHVIPHYAELIPNATFIDDVPGGHDTPTAAPDYVLRAFRD